MIAWLSQDIERVMVCMNEKRVKQLQSQYPQCRNQFKTVEEMVKKAQNEIHPIWVMAEDGRAVPKATEFVTDIERREIGDCCEHCSGRVEDENGFAHHYGCQNEDCECHVCETCGGDGFIEEMGDGDNFEYDVIATHPCPQCHAE